MAASKHKKAVVFSIVVPVFENGKNLSDTIPKLLSLKNSIDCELELVFVDDGSTDNSFEILSIFVEKHPKTIKVVKLTRNFGQTPATQAGLHNASGDCVGIISADLQEPFEKFIEMHQIWRDGAKFVIAERVSREEHYIHQKISGVYWRLLRRQAMQDFPKMGYDFCLLDRQVVNDVNLIHEKNSSIFPLIYWFGYQPVRIPTKRKNRVQGVSQWRFFNKIKFTMDTMIAFTYLPSRFITYSSFAASFSSLIYLAYLMVKWFSSGNAPLGWMTVVALLLLIGAMVLFALGLISEYLLRILDEVRKRPVYVIEKIIN